MISVGVVRHMTTRHLFLDPTILAQMRGFHLEICQPIKHPSNPIVRCENRWEMLGIQTYGTVIYDDDAGLFRMYYLTHAGSSNRTVTVDGVEGPANRTLLAYAESRDGIRWFKPDLGQVEFQGSRSNNILKIGRTNVEGASILYEPWDPDPERRYKAFYWEHGSGGVETLPGGGRLWMDGEGDGMWVSFSRDGINWSNYPHNPVIPMGSDTGQSVVYDPRIDRYVAFGRFGAGGRRGSRSESRDFLDWSRPEVVLKPDAQDGAQTDFYGISVSIYEGLYVGLLWVFHKEGASRPRRGPDRGTIDVQLVYSHDGKDWHRACGRQTFIANGPRGSWDSKIIQVSSRLVEREDDILVYYSGGRYRHGEARGGRNSEIGLAVLRRDGFVCLCCRGQGRAATRWFPKPCGDLHLNVDVQGELFVVLETRGGRRYKSYPMKGDHVDLRVEWRNAPRDIGPDEKVRLLFRGEGVRIYSFWFG